MARLAIAAELADGRHDLPGASRFGAFKSS